MNMNTRGFVKLPRSLLEWRWYGDLNTRSLYIHLLMTAAWDDAVYMNREIKRGQCCTTVKELAAINQRTIQQTRTALNHLVSTNDITIEATTQFSILTLTNYNELQPVGKPPADSFADRLTLAVGEFHHLRTYCESCLFNDEIVKVGVYIIRNKHSGTGCHNREKRLFCKTGVSYFIAAGIYGACCSVTTLRLYEFLHSPLDNQNRM